ncbi:unnamed protein product [Closterium sp. NIES-65]|nr:unnamed protein product [Closterium sp. NIES-65]
MIVLALSTSLSLSLPLFPSLSISLPLSPSLSLAIPLHPSPSLCLAFSSYLSSQVSSPLLLLLLPRIISGDGVDYKLTGSIPDSLSKLNNLTELNLKSNNRTGNTIPSTISALTNLVEL